MMLALTKGIFMPNSTSETSPKLLLLVLIVSAFVCIGGVYFLWFKGVGVGFGGTTETWSHFGSFFGGTLGPALSFFSLLGIIYTVYLQSKSNKEQAKANEHMTESIKSSELLSKENLMEQRIQFEEQIEYDKQKRTLDFLTNVMSELEKVGGDVYSDFVPKNPNTVVKIGPHFNLYSWKLRKTCPVVFRLRDVLDADSAKLLTLMLEVVIAQIDGFIEDIGIHGHYFNNPQDIPQCLYVLRKSKESLTTSYDYLNRKFEFNRE